MNAVDAVQAADFACHLALKAPKDDSYRMMLLEALARFKAMPLNSFPNEVLDLVGQSRGQADTLSDRILVSSNLSDPSIDNEIRAVCHSLGCLASAMRPSAPL